MNTSRNDGSGRHPVRSTKSNITVSKHNLPEVIGLSGRNCSGKDTLAEYLVKNFGYTHVSTGDILRAEAMKLYGNIERETLQKVAPAYKAAHGAGVFVELALKQPRPVVISGIRSMGELKAVKKVRGGGLIVFVDADPKLRYERMKKRARDAEADKSFKEFIQSDEKEKNTGPTDADYRVDEIDEKADIHLDNS